MLLKIRNWLICTLAGKSCVVINSHIYGELRSLYKDSQNGLIVHNTFQPHTEETPQICVELGKYERRR